LDLKDCGCSEEAKIDFLTDVPTEKKMKVSVNSQILYLVSERMKKKEKKRKEKWYTGKVAKLRKLQL